MVRITTSAAPGEILVSDANRIMIDESPDRRYQDTARVTLKGLEGEPVIHRLEWQS